MWADRHYTLIKALPQPDGSEIEVMQDKKPYSAQPWLIRQGSNEFYFKTTEQVEFYCARRGWI